MRNELRLRALRVIKASLRGRTGAALCRLCGQLLLYGGTLNGNFGPVLGDVLRLNCGATAASLAVREVVVTPPLHDDGHPGARRGHTMTATRIGDGTPVALVVGGWVTIIGSGKKHRGKGLLGERWRLLRLRVAHSRHLRDGRLQ